MISAFSKPGIAAKNRILHVARQAGRDAVDIDLIGLRPSGSRKSWCAVLVGEADDFVFDRRAVARPDAFDLPAYIGDLSRLARISSCVAAFVWVIQQGIWFARETRPRAND